MRLWVPRIDSERSIPLRLAASGPQSWIRSRSITCRHTTRVARLIDCECGTVVRGASVEELLRQARVHMKSNHPAIAEEITDDELLALSYEEPPRSRQAKTISD